MYDMLYSYYGTVLLYQPGPKIKTNLFYLLVMETVRFAMVPDSMNTSIDIVDNIISVMQLSTIIPLYLSADKSGEIVLERERWEWETGERDLDRSQGRR